MSNDLGHAEQGGFLPSAPGPQDIFTALGLGGNGDDGGWSSINKTPGGQALDNPRKQEAEDLQKAFAQVYATPAGKRVVEAIVGKTLRRAPYMNGEGATLEQQTAYGLVRQGQNGLATWILSMIHAGQNVKSAKKPAKKKS